MATLILAGAVLLLLETVLPGVVAGIVGFLCLVAGVVVAYNRYGPSTGSLVLLGVLAGLVTGGVIWIRTFPRSWLGRRFLSERVIGSLGAERPDLLHQTGKALTLLRPSGAATIGGRRVDVVTEGDLIEPGTPVQVVATEGLRVVVRALAPEGMTPGAGSHS